MLKLIISAVAGLLFGLGLIVSDMINPAKVLGFLDLFGSWDPSLAFVMAGAIVVGFIGFTYAKQKRTCYVKEPIDWPTQTKITSTLVIGSMMFGIGWGLAGFCPGPALVSMSMSVSMGTPKAIVFVIAMLIGMKFFSFLSPSTQAPTQKKES